MRAMVLHGQASIDATPLRLEQLPDPEPGPGEVRLRVRVCATCRTDLHVIEGDLQPKKMPIVPGHQIVGTVDKTGPGAKRFQQGERIGVAWLRHTDGVCEFCRRGCENLCPESRYTGWHADGGYAELAVVDERYAYRIPAAFTDVQAAPLLCAGIIGYRALRRSAVRDRERLGLFGFGSSAHVTLQVARARGCEVFVATRGERHRRLARELGAAWVGDSNDPMPAALDGAILFAPAGELVPPALRSLRKGGTLALAGIHLSPIPSMTYEPHLFHEKVLTSVEANTRNDGDDLLREAAAIGLRAHTTVYPLEQANEALRAVKHDGVEGTAVLTI